MSSPVDEVLLQAETVALRIVDSLPHTPISAFGVNFTFIEDEPPSEAIAIFKLPDAPIIQYEIMQTEITRKLRLESSVLNLKHAFDQKTLRLDFNFHHDTPTGADQVVKQLPGSVIASKAIAHNVLKAYKFDTGDENENAN
jgi:hypothetical protein